MVIQIGSTPLADFTKPLVMLSDCHRRIEMFLDMLIRVVNASGDGMLAPTSVGAVETALRYFANAAPLHMADEEDSLFPRLRTCGDSRTVTVMHEVDRLESEHLHATAMHDRIDVAFRGWLSAGSMWTDRVGTLRDDLTGLRETYRAHIAFEDDELFPLAAVVLAADDVAHIGEEMRERRKLQAR